MTTEVQVWFPLILSHFVLSNTRPKIIKQPMDLIYITNNMDRARVAQKAGVDRVMVDLEIMGKEERQGHRDTVVSHHSLEDVRNVRNTLHEADLLVRINPIFPGSREEIETCIALGADILMLPMFTTANEVEHFISVVSGRTRICLLLETAQALARVQHILDVPGIDEVHIGLNDLHLELKLKFMFELLSGGLIDYLAQTLRDRNIKFGFGGVSRLNIGLLKSNLILVEHARLGSTQVILSRDFNQVFENASDEESAKRFCEEVHLLRNFMLKELPHSAEAFAANTAKLRQDVQAIVERWNATA